MTLARQLGVLTPRIPFAPVQGSAFSGGRGFVPISAAFKKDDGSVLSFRAVGAGPAPAWYPQVRDGLAVVEAEVYPGAALYDTMTETTWTELGDRRARMATPRTWTGCTSTEAPSGSWSLSANGCPAKTLDPIGPASSQGSNFWDPPWALWSVDGNSTYRTNQSSVELDAQAHFGPYIQEAERVSASTLIPGSGVYNSAGNPAVPTSYHAAVWLATEPGAAERLRFAWSPFWPNCMANWVAQRSNVSAPFEGAPDGAIVGQLYWGSYGRHWQWDLATALGEPSTDFPTTAGDWAGSFWEPDPVDPADPATHDPPGQAIVWGVPYDGNAYLCDFASGGAVSVSFGGNESDLVLEWAPLTWQVVAGTWALVSGAWTAFHTGSIASVWTQTPIGLIDRIPLAAQPAAGQLVAVRLRYMTAALAYDIRNNRALPGYLVIPMLPAPVPWLIPTDSTSPAVVVGYRP